MNFYQSVSTNKALSINRFLDTYTDAVAAYSLRRLRTGHTGYAVEVRRASDNSTKDIGFDADGNFHVSALEEFCSGTDGYVTVWYDQTSNGYDLTQTDTTKQPRIYDSSTGIASLNSNDRAALGNSVGVVANPSLTNSSFSEDMSGGYSYYFVIGGAGYGDAIFMIGDGTTAQVGMRSGTSGQPTHYHTNSSNDRVNVVTTGFSNVNQRTAGHEVIQSAYFDGSSTSSVFISRDDGYNFTGSKTVGPLGSASALGGVIVNALKSSMDRPVQEFIIFGSDKSSQREEIESDINNYYTIGQLNYDLPLDTYTNAVGAWSVRKVRSAYTGYCMEVYNGATYADIGFNEFNELDVSAIATHCGSNDGFVSKWYSQGSSTKTFTQTDPALMPQIYDGTSQSVIFSNGKPQVQGTSITADSRRVMMSLSDAESINGVSSAHNFIVMQRSTTTVSEQNSVLAWGRYGSSNDSRYATQASNSGPARAGTGLHIDGVSNSSTVKSAFHNALGSNPRIVSSVQDYDSTTSNPAQSKTNLGADSTGMSMHHLQEFLVFDSSMSNDRETIENNQNTYFNVY